MGVCVTRGLVLAGLVIAGSSYFLYTSALAQGQNAGQTPRGPGANRPVAYPARPKAPQEVLDRGKSVYGVHCAFCHGSDAAGGEAGPNLLRSSVVLEDQAGELISPIVHGARVDKGMPRIPIEDAQIKDIAAWLHSLRVESRTDPNAEKINILTGDSKAGEAYFQKTCASCHSVTGDLKDIGAKFSDPKTLQQTWLLPGGGGGRRRTAPTPGIHVSPTTVTVTQANGQKVEGELSSIDDFAVALVQPDGTYRTFARNGSQPTVEIHDPLAPHRKLLKTYQDKDIHDLTAYLTTIK